MPPRPLLTLEALYTLCGFLLFAVAGLIVANREHPRRWGSAVFWLLLGVCFVGGKYLPPLVVGYMVIVMVLLAATKQVAAPRVSNPPRNVLVADAQRLGNRVFWPALLVPLIALVGSRLFASVHIGGFVLATDKQATLVSLGLGVLVALAIGIPLVRARPVTPVKEGGRLIETIGWALLLPQMLAALGGIFQRAGVGDIVAQLTARALPTQFPFVAVAAYCIAMAVFTVCMGNAFAAFPVITAGIGLPLIVQLHHGNPAIMAAIGMLSGYCGTLLTPMAANFNVVPAMLLELDDKNAVIKAQAPIAIVLLAANVALMYFCVFRF